MFKRNLKETAPTAVQAVERITSVLGAGVIWQGSITGSGGVRIEGVFEGQIALRGMLVVGETGRVTCENVRNNKSGLLFYKANGTRTAVAFQGGTLCVGPSGIRRTPGVRVVAM